jgi:hypothetical protein
VEIEFLDVLTKLHWTMNLNLPVLGVQSGGLLNALGRLKGTLDFRYTHLRNYMERAAESPDLHILAFFFVNFECAPGSDMISQYKVGLPIPVSPIDAFWVVRQVDDSIFHPLKIRGLRISPIK